MLLRKGGEGKQTIDIFFCANLFTYSIKSSHLSTEEWVNIPIFQMIYFMVSRVYVTRLTNFSSVQSLSHVRLFATPWISAHQASLSITNSQSLLKLMFIKLVMPSNHLILCHPLLLLPSIPPSIRVFSSESILHEVAKVLEFQLQHQSFQWTPISFRMGWLDLFAVQGTLKSLLQHHSSKASILRRWAFFTVQLSHPYKTTGKTTAWLTNLGCVKDCALSAFLC